MKGYATLIRIGGRGTFWDGYWFFLPRQRFRWVAWLHAWIYIRVLHPCRAAKIRPRK